MDDEAVLARLADLQRSIAAGEAELAAGMAEFVALRRAEFLGGEWASDEIAVELCCGRGRVLGQVRLAETLVKQLPATWRCWQVGDIDGYKARKVADAADRLLDPDSLAGFDAAAAAVAVKRTGPQLQVWLNRKVATLEPAEAEPRHQEAFGRRRLDISEQLDGMGELWTRTSALDLAAVDAQLTRLAKAVSPDDPRTLEQRRVDLFVDLLLGRIGPDGTPVDAAAGGGSGHGGSVPVAVAVTVPITSLLDLDDTPGVLCGGGGAVPPSVVREVLSQPGTLVYRLLTDPKGDLLDVTQLGRFPNAKLRFAVAARDQTCRFPSCNRPGMLDDQDHTVRYPDGPTAYANLGLLCRRHHRLKHSGQVGLRQIEPGVFEWTLPSGKVYTVRPAPQPVGHWPPPEPEPPPKPEAANDPGELPDLHQPPPF